MSQKDEEGDEVTRCGAPNSNQNAEIVHGGAGAVKRIQAGKPFVGLAAQEEANVKADLETLGRAELVRENAIRLHTACRLYWGAVQSAADAGDLEKLDSYVARFGWLAGSALRAWAQMRQERPDERGVLDYEELLRRQREDEE